MLYQHLHTAHVIIVIIIITIILLASIGFNDISYGSAYTVCACICTHYRSLPWGFYVFLFIKYTHGVPVSRNTIYTNIHGLFAYYTSLNRFGFTIPIRL